MKNKPRIIVATDFSECSDHALRAGEQLRQRTQGELSVIHISPSPFEMEWFTTDAQAILLPPSFRESIIKDLKKRLDHQVRSCEVKAESHLVLGNAYKEMNKTLKKFGADIVIMGHKGHGAMKNIMGSFTTRMVATNEIPLLVINRPLNVKKVAGLVETEHPVKEIFETTENLGRIFSAQMEFISVWQDIGSLYTGPFKIRHENTARFTEDDIIEVKTTMENRIKEFMHTGSEARIRAEVVTDKSISGALTRILTEENIDLAVLSRNRQNIVEKVFIGSVARRVLETYQGNFIVLPPPA